MINDAARRITFHFHYKTADSTPGGPKQAMDCRRKNQPFGRLTLTGENL
jgi:hypothetical protein